MASTTRARLHRTGSIDILVGGVAGQPHRSSVSSSQQRPSRSPYVVAKELKLLQDELDRRVLVESKTTVRTPTAVLSPAAFSGAVPAG